MTTTSNNSRLKLKQNHSAILATCAQSNAHAERLLAQLHGVGENDVPFCRKELSSSPHNPPSTPQICRRLFAASEQRPLRPSSHLDWLRLIEESELLQWDCKLNNAANAIFRNAMLTRRSGCD